jgi:hypothetical protein
LVKGLVVKILSPTKVLINLGSLQGVTKGMRFVIYEEGEMIKDPKSSQPIERLELVKGEVQIIHVQQKMSIGESFSIETKTTAPYSALTAMATTKEEIKVTTPLTKEKVEEISPGPLKVGDLVRSL